MELVRKKCEPCETGTVPLSIEESRELARQISKWNIEPKLISRRFEFKNFKESMAFINKIASLAEEEGHHPDIYISFNKVKLDLFTHKIGGLSENDFILAAKIDNIAI